MKYIAKQYELCFLSSANSRAYLRPHFHLHFHKHLSPYKPSSSAKLFSSKKTKNKSCLSKFFFMSTTTNNNSVYPALILLYFLLFISCFDNSMARRPIPSSAPSTMVRPLLAQDRDYSTLNPQRNQKKKVYHAKELKGCLPKGFRPASAPSRFVNSHTLGLAGCSSRLHSKKRP